MVLCLSIKKAKCTLLKADHHYYLSMYNNAKTKTQKTSKASVKTQKPSAKKKSVSNFPKSKSGSAVNNAKLTQEQILAIKKISVCR